MLRTRIILFLIFTVAASHVVQSQSSSIEYEFRLQEVHFGGDAGLNYIPILQDPVLEDGPDGPTISNALFEAPHYEASSTPVSKPVAYVSDTRAMVKAIIGTDCTDSVYVRGTGPLIHGSIFTHFQFPSTRIKPEDGLLVYDFKDADHKFEDNVIKCYDNFYIDWEVSRDGDSWTPIGKSTNRLYVTRNVPTVSGPGPENYPAFHTIIEYSCHAAGGESDINEIVDEIYDGFEPDGIFFPSFPGIARASDGHVLTYHDGIQGVDLCGSNTMTLLAIGDGSCGSWARLLEDMLKVQGISGAEVTGLAPTGELVIEGGGVSTKLDNDQLIEFNAAYTAEFGTPPTGEARKPFNHQYFMVKHWGDVSDGDFVLLHEFTGDLPDSSPAYFEQYSTAQSAAGDAGIPGQGNVADPRSIFRNHGVVFYNGKIYDPSYGQVYASQALAPYEEESLDVVKGIMFSREASPDMHEFYIYVLSINTASEELQTF